MPSPDDAPRPVPDGGAPRTPTTDPRRRWLYVGAVVVVLAFILLARGVGNPKAMTLTYSSFKSDAKAGEIVNATVNNSDGTITGKLKGGVAYQTTGPVPSNQDDMATLQREGVSVQYANPSSSLLGTLLPYIFLAGLLILMVILIGRQTRSQMTGIMSIGRSKAKLFSEDRPTTTFEDVAGYHGVKQEISEVVDFLKNPTRFKEIGAKIPKGVLLIGPPGTGKTMLARAVAGEAGVPFLSVSGSDFMEMFVGVGASRVRDLFQTARKEAPAIIFVDEIDSIGRKRGAGLGGGHDEREQTLNQMLSEMDGFDTAEGVVMIGATNRPDVLDTALLRPGRFDRQIVVPLPDLDERLPILRIHSKNKRMSPDVDLDMVARGTPGMSGADLANLVNEAALHAVRRGAKEISMEDFENARDRVLMGQQRDSVVLGAAERERVAFHEGGHALLAYVLHEADPLHKITIIPRGLALGVTMQLPAEDRHIYSREKLEDDLCVRMGGRVAELLVYGDLSTGAADDLVRNTELARRMVREWGMSKEIGPMAWGSQGQVFLGEDLIHTRDYSDDTSKVIDDEVERILREQEARAIDLLTQHRRGLDAVAHALLESETLDGETVGRLVDEAFGRPVYADGRTVGSSLRPAARPADDDAPTNGEVPQNGVAAPTGAPSWAPPTIPAG
ncbi:MAG TPA: ATP-dependent zinc metalloprotease FtsH [Acidimicrobiales bacterium]|nr:ATP-dependent zinc metalloprotease FtsH [Acidimicrobiales bacterium]